MSCPLNRLHHRFNLTLVCNVCETVLRSLVWAPYGLSKLPEVCFKFLFNMIGKSAMAFFNRPIMARTQILVHRWGPRTRFWHCFADGLNQSLVSFLVQATPLNYCKRNSAIIRLANKNLGLYSTYIKEPTGDPSVRLMS